MSSKTRGHWVEIERTILQPGERAPQVPEDTRAVPYVMRVSGFYDGDPSQVRPDQEIQITTLIGRHHQGRLVRVNPSYDHSFGNTVPELLTIGISGEEV